jgi:hypothetical protein
MNKTRIVVVVALLVVALLAVGLSTYKFIESNHRSVRDERIAKEVEAAVEAFLRAGGASDHPAAIVDEYHAEIAKSLPKDIGEFARMEGSGFSYPVWGITLSPYLDLRRTAHFTHGSIPMRIIVTNGARGSKVGTPQLRDHMVYVSHPDLVD